MDAQLLDRETAHIAIPEPALTLLDRETVSVVPEPLPPPPDIVLLDTRTVPVVPEAIPVEVVLLDIKKATVGVEEEEKEAIEKEEAIEERERVINWWLWGGLAVLALIAVAVIARGRGS